MREAKEDVHPNTQIAVCKVAVVDVQLYVKVDVHPYGPSGCTSTSSTATSHTATSPTATLLTANYPYGCTSISTQPSGPLIHMDVHLLRTTSKAKKTISSANKKTTQ